MRGLAACLSALAAVLLFAGPLAGSALGELKRVTVRQGPLAVPPYGVRFTSPRTREVRAPRLDGWLVRMHARVVDARGRPMPVREVMLHHIVYKNRSRRDSVCAGAESFYGTGEENQTLDLPPGYGYRVRRQDRWFTGWMLMNHRSRLRKAFIEYSAWIETSRRLRPVVPYWVRATGCHGARDPIFNVPGMGGPGAIFTHSAPFKVPHNGRIVAGSSHLHGGARALLLTQPACGGRTLMSSQPLYGLADHPYYNVLPVLHEPGPIATGWVTSPTGVPVRRGERLRATAVYDDSRPHTRAMGIWHLYLTPDQSAPAGCPPLPGDVTEDLPPIPGRSDPPAVTVPLTGIDARGRAVPMLTPPGPLVRRAGAATVRVGAGSYSVRRLSIAMGGRVRWRFRDRGLHDVTLASGPVGFASRWKRRGESYARRFNVPGTYRLFCSLHPVAMNQVVDVRSGP
jgi:Stress up-regulated Nod 19